MEKMLDLMQEPVEVKDLPQAASLKATKGDVVFDNVSFYYDKRSPTLRNISFRVPSGTTVALVGESGSGKSTITRLLLRFFDVASGRILIDGHDVRFVKQEELRKCIGVVPQVGRETVLFNDTIRYMRGAHTSDFLYI
ncbi:P-loop containing nucleoside triphosphate hydrolase protein [Jimgerdemannia flammicorona]|uniref:P-loop containing nucleoside triphosphate hydrolase protein n=1 Tax=Jimgerdemannia flammicorona TaxID=994334 RepID=A0A433Q369_9FUNG|nr:P-loop containing nucleoside triphosphate hydrolase protein [Jimgerdemannia flammicorona]